MLAANAGLQALLVSILRRLCFALDVVFVIYYNSPLFILRQITAEFVML